MNESRPSPSESVGAPQPVRVASANHVVLRLYDVAFEIDLAAVDALAAEQLPTARLRLSRAEPKAMAYGAPPVAMELGAVDVPGAPSPATVAARVYDFGVISVALRFEAEDMAWEAYVAHGLESTRAAAAPELSELWSELLGRVMALVEPALVRPAPPRVEEDYTLFVVRAFDHPIETAKLPARVDLVPLLSGETRTLSERARTELLRNRYSYYPDDLVVLTWDRAFLCEPGGETDVADVLEVANAQLLELRYYDDRLDDELPRMYDRVAAARSAFAPLVLRRYGQLARDLLALVAEVTELTERVDNAIKVTEDVYLARIYGAALDVFRVRAWGAAVDRKLTIIRETYQSLYDEAATARAELLEATIVVLIVLELVLAFRG